MRFGRFEPNLPRRAPYIPHLDGDARIYVDFQLDGAVHGVPFSAFQVRRPPPPRSVSTYTPEFTAVLVPRPVPGPSLRLAPQRLSWATVFRRDVEVGDPHFDAAFHVSTESPDFARHLLRPPLTTWLASDSRAGQVIIAFQPGDLMALVQGPLTPDNAMGLADLMATLQHRTPWQSLQR